jgi:hypothetical protein
MILGVVLLLVGYGTLAAVWLALIIAHGIREE